MPFSMQQTCCSCGISLSEESVNCIIGCKCRTLYTSMAVTRALMGVHQKRQQCLPSLSCLLRGGMPLCMPSSIQHTCCSCGILLSAVSDLGGLYVWLQTQEYVQQHGDHTGTDGSTRDAAAMPARSELLAAGQDGLVRAIEHAGGFLQVAQVYCDTWLDLVRLAPTAPIRFITHRAF